MGKDLKMEAFASCEEVKPVILNVYELHAQNVEKNRFSIIRGAAGKLKNYNHVGVFEDGEHIYSTDRLEATVWARVTYIPWSIYMKNDWKLEIGALSLCSAAFTSIQCLVTTFGLNSPPSMIVATIRFLPAFAPMCLWASASPRPCLITAANSVDSSANRYRVSIGMERCDGRRVNVVKVLGCRHY